MGFYILPNEKGFYDPDGYFFDQDGFDMFGGYYDNDGYYHPGKKNDRLPASGSKKNDIDDDDELIKAFERGDDANDDDADDHRIKKYLSEYK